MSMQPERYQALLFCLLPLIGCHGPVYRPDEIPLTDLILEETESIKIESPRFTTYLPNRWAVEKSDDLDEGKYWTIRSPNAPWPIVVFINPIDSSPFSIRISNYRMGKNPNYGKAIEQEMNLSPLTGSDVMVGQIGKWQTVLIEHKKGRTLRLFDEDGYMSIMADTEVSRQDILFVAYHLDVHSSPSR